MKKYLAAAAVAVMVFAFAAMAASFDVADQTLASGVGEVTGCDDPIISYTTSNDGQGFWVGAVNLDFGTTTDCDGEHVAVSLMDAPAGVPNVSPQQLAFGISANPITDGLATVDFEDGPLRVEDIEQIQVLVGEQGTPGFSVVN